MRLYFLASWHWAVITAIVIFLNFDAKGQEPKAPSLAQDASVVVFVDIAAMRAHPDLQLIPWEVMTASGKETVGADPLAITQAWGGLNLLESPEPEFGISMQVAKPIDIANLNPDMFDKIRTSERMPGVRVRRMFSSNLNVVQNKDQYMLGTEGALRQMMTSKDEAHPLTELIAKDPGMVKLIVSVPPIRPILMNAIESNSNELPEDLIHNLRDMVETAEYIYVRFDGNNLSRVYVHLGAKDDANLDKLSQQLQQLELRGIESVEQVLREEVESGAMNENLRGAWNRYLTRLKALIQSASKPQKQDGRLTVVMDQANSAPAAAIAIGLLLPAVQAARQAARRMQSMNNLKQHALAFHNWESAYRKMPPRFTADADGKPLLSWRVHLLPYYGEQELYSQFHLDEPWDSEHNAALVEKIPSFFRDPRSKAPPGHTTYVAPFGGEAESSTIWDLDEGRFANVTDGLSNTILFMSVPDSAAVPWTKPDDIDIEQVDLPKLLQENGDIFLVALADGSVQTMSVHVDIEILKSMLSCGGGEVVPIP